MPVRQSSPLFRSETSKTNRRPFAPQQDDFVVTSPVCSAAVIPLEPVCQAHPQELALIQPRDHAAVPPWPLPVARRPLYILLEQITSAPGARWLRVGRREAAVSCLISCLAPSLWPSPSRRSCWVGCFVPAPVPTPSNPDGPDSEGRLRSP